MQEALHSGLPELGLAVKLKACLDEQVCKIKINERSGDLMHYLGCKYCR
jgi:hypothetical protein